MLQRDTHPSGAIWKEKYILRCVETSLSFLPMGTDAENPGTTYCSQQVFTKLQLHGLTFQKEIVN